MRKGRGCPGNADRPCAAHRGGRHRYARSARDRAERDILAAADGPAATALAVPGKALKVCCDIYGLGAIGIARDGPGRPRCRRIAGALGRDNGIACALRLDRTVVGTSLGVECNNRAPVNGERAVGIIGKAVPVVRNKLAGRYADDVRICRFVIGLGPVYDDGKVLAA